MLLLSLALKLGFHPSTLARLSTISSNFQKQVPIGPLNHMEDYYLYLTVIICYLYLLWRDGKLGFASPFFRGM
jgi:hypothetical protein